MEFNVGESMEHKLRVLVRLDLDPTSAVLEVTGCLTVDSCHALPPLIRRTASLVGGHLVTVDLTPAKHIERDAVSYLEGVAGGGRDVITELRIQCPEKLPDCPSLRLLPAGVAL